VPFRSKGDPILTCRAPGNDPRREREFYDTVGRLQPPRLDEVGDPEIATRINAYEMAYRMQTSAPELMDCRRRDAADADLYGAEAGQAVVCQQLPAGPPAGRAGRAVRAALSHRLGPPRRPGQQPGRGARSPLPRSGSASAALVLDLKQRGLLDDTLVVWGGEFGRTPMGEVRATIGRDHHIDAFTMWLAGGGVKGGYILGETDELGFGVVEDKVHVHDLHATILHLLGFDHHRLTYRFQGRDFRLTDVHGSCRRCWRRSTELPMSESALLLDK
jgi:hypothetical protein